MINSFSGKYEFLSNFYPTTIKYAGIYPSAEHAYQASKTLDAGERMAIAMLPAAAHAKRAGRKVTLRADWEENKLAIMEFILMAKFSEPLLAQLLIETGEQELVEGNYWGDTYWGVCNGEGENHLGKLLMKVRSYYSKQMGIPLKPTDTEVGNLQKGQVMDKEKGNIFFISDNHFGHKKIIQYEHRPFSSVEQMDREMVRRWNKKVADQDDVYILGDFAFSNPAPILKQLNGRKHLVLGNHDKHILRNEAALKHFVWVKDYYRLRVSDLHIIMFHFPIMVWDMEQFGSIHLHGHVHSMPELRHPQFQRLKNSYNVGVDVNNYEPISLETILNRLDINQAENIGA